MEDKSKISEFLNLIYAAKMNGIQITSKMVYANLVRMGVSEYYSSENYLIDDNFYKWINRFSNVDNIDVFVDSKWTAFCQFVNDPPAADMRKAIKLYIPLDTEHIYEDASKIFMFLAENNIKHHSKIAKKVRFDDLVIRVYSEDDVYRIKEFVMLDPYIREGLLKPNPFAYNDGFISYAWDGYISYNNNVVANYISLYINNLGENAPSFTGFVNYVTEVYLDMFENNNKHDYLSKMNIFPDVINKYKSDTNDSSAIALLNDFEIATRVFLNAAFDNKNISSFFSDVKKFSSDEYFNFNFEKISNLVKSHDNLDNNSFDVIAWFNNTYNYMVSKYGIDDTFDRYIKFFESNNSRLFTRDNNIRYMITDNEIDSKKIIDLILNLKQNLILERAVYSTYNKYGMFQVKGALQHGVNGDFSLFTNDNFARRDIKTNVISSEIMWLMKCKLLFNGYNINDISLLGNQIYDEYLDVCLNNIHQNTQNK